MICWGLDTLEGLPFDEVIVAAPADRIADFEALVRGRGKVVAGGSTRAESVRRAFERAGALPRDVVCIHDAARPLVSAGDVASVISAAERSGAAIAATPIVDTVKRVEGDRIVATVDRAGLWSAGTPQAFRADLLRQGSRPDGRRLTRRRCARLSESRSPSCRSRGSASRSPRRRTSRWRKQS